MGRADLSRYRKSSPADTPPVAIPSKVEWAFTELSSHSHAPIVKAASSIKNATTQRAQVHSVKLLGYALRDSHREDLQNHPSSLKCACITKAADEVSVCRLVAPILLAFLFDTPSATSGLISSALRAVITAQESQVPCLQHAIDDFLLRLAQWGTTESQIENDNSAGCTDFSRAAADACAVAVVLGDPTAREWITKEQNHVIGALRLIVSVMQVYLGSNANENAARMSARQEGEKARMQENARVINPNVLERACDASVKAAQDLINYILKASASKGVEEGAVYNDHVSSVVQSCFKLLQCPATPRSFTSACAVAYISGLVLIASLTERNRVVVSTIQGVLKSLGSFPPFSQLSLLRAVMEAPAAREAHSTLLFPVNGKHMDPSHMDVFSSLASFVRSSDDVHLRFLAMDAVISCIRRRAPEKLDNSCRTLAIELVNGRMHEPFPGIASQIRDAMDALIETDGDDDEAMAFWVHMSHSLLREGWTSKGLYALLTPLLKRIGAFRVLRIEPECQQLAMRAIGQDSKLCKLVSEWLGSLWRALWADCSERKEFHQICHHPLLDCLLDPKYPALRDRTREYVLPIFLKVSGQENLRDSAFALLATLRMMEKLKFSVKLRGVISILSAARQLGCLVESFSDSDLKESLEKALQSGEEDIRMAALDLIVFSKVPTEPISKEELRMIQTFLPSALMPGSSLADQSRFRHSMRRFLERFATCRHAARDGCGGWWMRERKERHDGERTNAFEKQRIEFLERIEDFYACFANTLISSTYPGATVSRRTNALSVLTLLVKNLGLKSYFSRDRIIPKALVASIVACFMDEWERPRRGASEVISQIEKPVPGFCNDDDAIDWQMFALPLLDSARQKDVDSGASIITCMFQKYITEFKEGDINHLASDATTEKSQLTLRFGLRERTPQVSVSSAISYANSVLDSLGSALERSQMDFLTECRSGLFHGRCLLLRQILQALPWKEYRSRDEVREAAEFVQRVIAIFSEAMKVALKGVAFESWDGVEERSCRNADQDSLEDPILLTEEQQYIRTSCFLSLKEICVAIGVLGHEAPLRAQPDFDGDDRGVLTSKQITTLCESLVQVFTSTRHWGVIDGASEGLQLITERLLQAPSVDLRAMPSIWIQKVLSSALSGGFYVLRRSAGVPFLILSILSSEASNHRRYLDTPLLDAVMTDLLGHLEQSHMFKNESLLSSNRSREEEAVSHALNLLRTLFLSADLASSILKYFESTMICCIRAFCSASWLIRNSAMMLYSALVRRGIGLCAERRSDVPLSSFDASEGTSAALGGGYRLRNITATQFFSRYPRLHPVMLEELQKAVFGQGTHKITDHPALFPILYILASLAPSTVEDPIAANSLLKFRDVLKHCIRCQSHDIRRVAASASVLLVETTSRVPGFISDLLSEQPEDPLTAESKAEASGGYKNNTFGTTNEKPSVPYLNHNRVHGELLVITAVLKEAKSRMSFRESIMTVRALATCLPSRIWLARNEQANYCEMTKGAMALLLVVVFDLVHSLKNSSASKLGEDLEHVTTLSDLCAEAALHLQQNVHKRSKSQRAVADVFFYASASELLGAVTLTYFKDKNWTFDFCLETLTREILGSRRETVRQGLVHLKRLFGLYSSTTHDQHMAAQEKKLVQNALQISCNLVVTSPYQNITVEALLLIRAILECKEGYLFRDIAMESDIIALVKEHVFEMAKSHPCVDVREQALVLVGHVISCIASTDSLVSSWMYLIEELASSEVLASTRLSVCDSITRSELCVLENPVHVEGEFFVRGCLVVAHLLEDSSAEVRKSASAALCGFKSIGFRQDHLNMDVLPSLMTIFEILGTRFGSSEVVLRHISYQLSSSSSFRDGGKDPFLRLLSEIAGIGPAGILEENRKRDEEMVHSELSSRLFELEDFTPEGEPVLRMQLSAWCVRKIVSLREPRLVSHQSAYETCKYVLAEVRNGLSRKSEYTGNENCLLGERTFTVEGFQSCYQSLLRLYVAVFCFCLTKSSAADNKLDAEISDNLEGICIKFGSRLHPTILSALYGIHDIIVKDEFSTEEPLRAIFFLLRVSTEKGSI